jgi:hypothetical protein
VKPGLSRKLQIKNRGPFSVVAKNGPITYIVEPLGGGNRQNVHVQRMIKFLEPSSESGFEDQSKVLQHTILEKRFGMDGEDEFLVSTKPDTRGTRLGGTLLMILKEN